MNILIINGPNLNLLGKREPGIYGTESFESFFAQLQKQFPGVYLSYFQSNIEGELINKLHEAGFPGEGLAVNGIILNAGGYTHTSVALGDAIAAIRTPVAEVHISNVHAREEFRHRSFLSKNCIGVISGFGLDSYRLALLHLISRPSSNISNS